MRWPNWRAWPSSSSTSSSSELADLLRADAVGVDRVGDVAHHCLDLHPVRAVRSSTISSRRSRCPRRAGCRIPCVAVSAHRISFRASPPNLPCPGAEQNRSRVPTKQAGRGVRIHWQEEGSGPPVVVISSYWSMHPRPSIRFSPSSPATTRRHLPRPRQRRVDREGPYDLETAAADLAGDHRGGCGATPPSSSRRRTAATAPCAWRPGGPTWFARW